MPINMKRLLFLVVLCVSTSAFAGVEGALVRSARSLLNKQSFPKTFGDVGFIDRNIVLEEGYDTWEPVFDSNGRCVSGCAYVGITFEQEKELEKQQTELALSDARERGLIDDEIDATDEEEVVEESQQQQKQNLAPQPVGYHKTETTGKKVAEESQQQQQKQKPAPQPVGYDKTETTDKKVAEGAGKTKKQKKKKPASKPVDDGKFPYGMPLKGKPRITSVYGDTTGRDHMHRGIDLSAPIGTNVYATASGRVVSAGYDNASGKKIKIKHEGGYETVFYHLSQHLVKEGDFVNDGDLIAKTGNTGRSSGPHLHYGISRNGTFIDPTKFLGLKN